MARLAKTGDVTMMDVPKFVKTFCRILTYRTSIRRFFENSDNMYKMLHPDDSLSEAKFRALLQSLRPIRGSSDRKSLDAFLSHMTRHFGTLFLDVRNGSYSTDDDKHKARSTKSIAEGFVRKRHSVGGGYGSVMHMCVSALSGFITGGVMNSVTGNDVKSLKEMYISMTSSRSEELNLENMQQEFDRGYKKEAFLSELDDWNGLHRGTHPRTPCLTSFPFTFGHPTDPRNIDEHGPSISRFSERGTKGLKGYMSALAHRDFKGSVVLMSTNHKSFPYPIHRSYQDFMNVVTDGTVNGVEDTILGGCFEGSDDDDAGYEPERQTCLVLSDSEENTDDDMDGGLVEETSPILGSVVSSQASLVDHDYGSDGESSSVTSEPLSSKRLTRLQRVGSVDPLEYEDGMVENIEMSDISDNVSSHTDSDTSDDDVMYNPGNAEEPEIDEYASQKHIKIADIPTVEELVCSLIFQTDMEYLRLPITL
jgi:hypothetical protein